MFSSILYRYLMRLFSRVRQSMENRVRDSFTLLRKIWLSLQIFSCSPQYGFYANKTLFKSNLVSRKSKLKLYWSVIRPTAVYGCETWVLKESIIQKLSVFERKILRKIFWPTKEANGIWRI